MLVFFYLTALAITPLLAVFHWSTKWVIECIFFNFIYCSKKLSASKIFTDNVKGEVHKVGIWMQKEYVIKFFKMDMEINELF